MAFQFRNPFVRVAESVPEKVLGATADYQTAEGHYGGNVGWGESSPGFTPSGGSIGSIYGYNWHFVARRAEKMAVVNGLFHRLHEIMRDNVCGQGLGVEVDVKGESPSAARLKTVKKSLQEICDDNFFGEKNRVDLSINQWVFEQFLFGELAILPSVDEIDGSVVWGYIPPRTIRDVVVHPFVNKALRIQLDMGMYDEKGEKMQWDGKAQWLDVINFDSHQWKRDEKGKDVTENGLPQKNPEAGTLQGSVFYLRTGNVLSQVRGQGEGFPVMDMILELESFQYSFQKAYNIQTSIVFHIQGDGWDEKKCAEQSKVKLPTGRVPYVTNQGVKLTMLSPALKVDDLSNAVRSYLVQIGGALGVPEFMLGDGSMTNVATAREQAPALYQKFRTRQTLLESFLAQMLRYVIEQKNKRGMIRDDAGNTVRLTAKELNDLLIKVAFRPFERNNSTDIVSSLTSLINGVILGTESGLMSKKLARTSVHRSMAPLGIEVDDAEELKEISRDKGLTGTGSNGKPIDVSLTEGAPDSSEPKIADLVLNGAQMQAAADIVRMVAAGEIPRDSGVNLLKTSLQVSEEIASDIMGTAGTTTPTTPNPNVALNGTAAGRN